ncbi:restriction endonuclease subunit S [Vreelandella arcis]|uniref:Type I restriction enzyme, S subunit n=1 Tax=Vreelandella arcis TaxID=416873 RepID=A0A1H0J5M1_9GAMM|nr:restriction endonuclease subunit S [Halomonas arcis]SDO39078.1 type I restriction enzyme, S subunit [Halomonas arcis]
MTQCELPPEWLHIQLGEIVSYGKTQKCVLADVTGDTWVLELEDVEKESSRLLGRKTAKERPFKSTKNQFEKGNVLYGKLRPYLNKVVVADTSGVCTTEIIPLDAEPFVLNRYLFHWLKTRDFLNYVNQVSYGVNMPRLGTKDGVAAPFVLAPLAEQKVIADKLDTLLAQVENTKARLERIPQILKRFRQSVLAAAVSGRLIDVQPKSAAKLEDLVDIENGARKPVSATIRKNLQGTVPYYGATGIVDYLNDYTHKGRYLLVGEDGANLLSKSKDLAFIVEGKMWVNNHAHVLKERLGVNLDFVKIAINSLDLTSWITGSAQPKLTKKSLCSLPITNFTIGEQTEIVRRVDQLFAHADRIEQQVNSALARVDKLTQSILAKAFRGELTEQWRKDNPELISGENSAEALLERIKAEKAASKPAKKARKQTTA